MKSNLTVVIEDCSDLIDAPQLKTLDKPDKHHSLRSHLVKDQKHLKSLPVKLPIKWPDMSDDDVWKKFDNRVFYKLHPVTSLAARVEILEAAVYETAVETFGHPESRNQSKKLYTKRNHIIELVHSKNELLSLLKDTAKSAEEIEGLQSLLLHTRQNLRKLRKRITAERSAG